MKLVKFGSKDESVLLLQNYLKTLKYDIVLDGYFGPKTLQIVKKFQQDNGLIADGIVGNNTWKMLTIQAQRISTKPIQTSQPQPNSNNKTISEEDFKWCANTLGVDVATIKAVKEVESGRYGGFIADRQPPILFEGHIFWKRLKEYGLTPEQYINGNGDILYPTWVKTHYLGGLKEYDRLNKAMKIHSDAALESASWGMFQIMGFNYKVCGCDNVRQFVEKMKTSEGEQLKLFVNFIIKNGLAESLRNKNWAEFACKYNGPGYAENQYDIKLANAYNKYK